MKHLLLALWLCLLLTGPDAVGQTALQRMLPKQDSEAPKAPVDPPYPQHLSADWWQYFADAGEALDARVAETLSRLDTLTTELKFQGREALLPLMEQVSTALSAYRELRKRPPPTPGVLPPVPEKVDLHTFLSLDQRLRDLRREVAEIAQNMESLNEAADLGNRQLNTARVAYLELLSSAQDTLEPGLQLMRDRLRLELAWEDLRLRHDTHNMRGEELKKLEPLVADAAARLAVSAEDAGEFERRAKAARERGEALDIELAQRGLEREYGTPETPVEQAAARLREVELAETEVRRARAQVEAALYATAAALPGGVDHPGADATILRALLEEARLVRRSAGSRLGGWQSYLRHERDDAMRGLGTVEGASGTTARVNRARLQVTDTMSEGLAGLSQAVQDLQRVIDVATSRLVNIEGLVGGSLAGLRAFSTHTLAYMRDWFSASLFEVGNAPVTPVGLFRVALIIAVALLISRMVRRGLDRMRSRREGVSQAALYTLSRMLHYLLLILGTVIALSSIGIDFTKFALFATALGVGIGFGLQTLISNFVAGIIILFERSLKVGDFIDLESGVQGEVKEINIRSTLVTTNENIDVVVPNAEFISGRVVNWTMQAPTRRIHLPFPVAFGADRELVRRAGLEAARDVPFTLNDTGTKPQVWLVGFDEDRMKFELVVWLTPNAVKRPSAVSAAYYWALAAALDRNGIAMPFPQRDLHFKSYYGLSGPEAAAAASPPQGHPDGEAGTAVPQAEG
jgi:small-conductance mechanosensitive channel